jgi:NAD(P)H-hydrate epimerase
MPVFRTESGREVPSVTADEMREVDRVAVEGVELGMLQMVENAGRTLAGIVRREVSESTAADRRHGGSERAQVVVGRRAADATQTVVLVGGGGNGAGGLCAVRHLRNRGWPVRTLLDRDPTDLSGPASRQCRILSKSGVEVTAAGTRSGDADGGSGGRDDTDAGLTDLLADADLVVDALIGYGLSGPPRGATARLIEAVDASETPVVSLDVPSGLLATTGETPGVAVTADTTLTLALPKTGLADDGAAPELHPAIGDLLLADIGIPPAVYRRVGFGRVVTDGDAGDGVEGDDAGDADQTDDPVAYRQPFDGQHWVRLVGVRR